MKDADVEKLLELFVDSRRGSGGIVPVGMPLRVEWLEGILVEGKEESEVWRFTPLALPVVPLVEGRYDRTDVIFMVFDCIRIFESSISRTEAAAGENHTPWLAGRRC